MDKDELNNNIDKITNDTESKLKKIDSVDSYTSLDKSKDENNSNISTETNDEVSVVSTTDTNDDKKSQTIKQKAVTKSKNLFGFFFYTAWFASKIFIRIFIALSFFLFIFLNGLIFSESGSDVLWKIVKNNIPGLQGEYVKGHLGRGISINNFSYKYEGVIDIEAKQVELQYSLLSLFKGRFDVDSIRVSNLLIVLGVKPYEINNLNDFLAKRLYEVFSYKVETGKKLDKVITRFRESQSDDTVTIAPIDLSNLPEQVRNQILLGNKGNSKSDLLDDSEDEEVELTENEQNLADKFINYVRDAFDFEEDDEDGQEASVDNIDIEHLKKMSAETSEDIQFENDTPIEADDKIVKIKEESKSDYYDELFTWFNVPIKVHVEDLYVDKFLYLSDVIDVAVDDFYFTGGMKGFNIYGESVTANFVDVLLHDERFESNKQNANAKTNVNIDTNNSDLKVKSNLYANAIEQDKNANKPIFAKAKLLKNAKNIKTAKLKNPFNRQLNMNLFERLPSVIMPMNIYVDKFVINNGRYHQSNYDTGVMSIKFSGSFVGSTVTLNYFKALHTLGYAELSNSYIDLIEYYPIRVNLNAYSENTDWFDLLHTHKLQAFAEGDLLDLKANFNTVGKIDSESKVRINVMSSSIPMEFVGNFKHVVWPMLEPEYSAPSVFVKAKGDLYGGDVSIKADDIQILDFPKFNMDTVFKTNYKELFFKKLIVKNDYDNLDVKGSLSWDNSFASAFKVDGKLTKLERYLGYLQNKVSKEDLEFVDNSNLGFSFEGLFELVDSDNWDLELKRANVKGSVDERDFVADVERLSLRVDSGKYKGSVASSKLVNGVNELSLRGYLNKNIDLYLDYDIKETNLLHKDFAGGVAGNFVIKGKEEDFGVNLNLNTEFLSYLQYKFEGLGVSLKANYKQDFISNIDANINTSKVRYLLEPLLNNLNVTLTGNENNHKLKIKGNLEHRHKVYLDLQGNLDRKKSTYEGVIKNTALSIFDVFLEQNRKFEFFADYRNKFKLNVKAHSWKLNNSLLNIKDIDYKDNNGEVDFALPSFNINSFRSWLPGGLSVNKGIQVNGKVGLKDGLIYANLDLNSHKNQIVYENKIFNIRDYKIKADLKDNNLSIEHGVMFGSSSKMEMLFNVAKLDGKRELSGHVDFSNFDIGPSLLLFDELTKADGSLNGQVNFEGTLDKPLLNGDLSIVATEILPVVDIGIIKDIRTDIKFKHSTAIIESIFGLGDGKGKITGSVSWIPQLTAKLHLTSDELTTNILGYGTGNMIYDLNAEYFDNLAKVRGSITVPKLRFTMKELPESSVQSSSDVMEITQQEDGSYTFKKKTVNMLDLDVNLIIGEDVLIKSMGVTTRIKGGVKLIQKPDKEFSIYGNIKLYDGTFRAYGQNLVIEEGKVSFLGDASNPILDIRAVRNRNSMVDENIVVGVMVSGAVSSPRIKIFSNPAMSETDALSYLVRGKKMETGKNDNSDMGTELLIGVGLMETSGIVSKVGEIVGVEDMHLETKGDGDETRVELSVNVMRDLEVAYGYQVYNSLSEYRARYQLLPKLYIEYTKALDQALDLIYKFEF
jgi:translocation and assembly module TamB